MRFILPLGLLLIAFSFISYPLNLSWFDFLPMNDTVTQLLNSFTYIGSMEGIILPILILAIHYAPTASQMGRLLYCLLPIIIAVSALGWGIKAVFQQPRPNVEMLAEMKMLPLNFYAFSEEEKHELMVKGLKQATNLPAPLKNVWQGQLGYSFPSGHALVSMTVAIFFAGLFFNAKRKKTAVLVLFWGVAICYSRLLLGVHRPEDVFVGAIIGALAALFALRWNRNKEAQAQAKEKQRQRLVKEGYDNPK